MEPNDTSRRHPLQRFATCFELAWKNTKDFMEANGFLFAVWIAMLDHRNLLSHTYNPAVFEKAVAAIHRQ